MAITTCTCPELRIDGRGTGSHNWNPDCLTHGTHSDWYQSPEQVAQREADSVHTKFLQAEARRRRQEAADEWAASTAEDRP